MPPRQFKCSLTKIQIEIMLGLICNEREIKACIKHRGSVRLKEISRITCLDYFGALHRYKDWLIDKKILVPDGIEYDVDYDAIAELLFDVSEFKYMYDFAFNHLEYWM